MMSHVDNNRQSHADNNAQIVQPTFLWKHNKTTNCDDASKQSSALQTLLAISHFLLLNMTAMHDLLFVFSCFSATMFEIHIGMQSNDTHSNNDQLSLRVNSHSHLHAHSPQANYLKTHSAHLLKTISRLKNCHWSTCMTKTSVRTCQDSCLLKRNCERVVEQSNRQWPITEWPCHLRTTEILVVLLLPFYGNDRLHGTCRQLRFVPGVLLPGLLLETYYFNDVLATRSSPGVIQLLASSPKVKLKAAYTGESWEANASGMINSVLHRMWPSRRSRPSHYSRLRGQFIAPFLSFSTPSL